MIKTIRQKLSNVLELTHSHEKNSNISSMEGIRGAAALLVFIEHYVVVLNDKVGVDQQYWVYDLFLWLKNIGNVGVELFFVLSGYLIYGSIIRKKKPFLPYLWRRAERIYPTFIAVFLLYIVLSFLIPEYNKIPVGIYASFSYMVHNLLFLPPLFSEVEPLITVSWSLSYEVFFYLIIPLLVGIFRLRKWPVNQRILFFIVISIVGFCYYYYYKGPIRMLMFVVGILLFDIINNKRKEQTTTPYLGLILFIFTLISIVMLMVYKVPKGNWWRTLIIYFGFFTLCYECFSWQSPSAKLFSITPLRWLGNMSYSYYLTHGLAVKFIIIIFSQLYFTAQIDSFSSFILFGFLVFALTLVPAFILFFYIEKPLSLTIKQK